MIRPRRFGKTLWVSLLENYYDRWWGHEFESVFAGTDIGRNPTAERHRYVVLRFNFSMVNDRLDTLERESRPTATPSCGGRCDVIPICFPKQRCGRSSHRRQSPPGSPSCSGMRATVTSPCTC